MSIAETPIAALLRGQRSTSDGLHLVARTYEKGVRLDTHMHREAQLVYAARGTMQVTTPKGRWLVPPDRAVWVPAGTHHVESMRAPVTVVGQPLPVSFGPDEGDRVGHRYSGECLDQRDALLGSQPVRGKARRR